MYVSKLIFQFPSVAIGQGVIETANQAILACSTLGGSGDIGQVVYQFMANSQLILQRQIFYPAIKYSQPGAKFGAGTEITLFNAG